MTRSPTELMGDFTDWQPIRLLAEHAIATVELAALYDEVRGEELKKRVIRLLADRDDEPAVAKMIAVAEGDPDPDLRRFAVRRLADTQHPSARAFIERSVRRP